MQPATKELRRAIGHRIRDLRTESDLSQAELAGLAGLDRTYVGRLERAESAATVDSIAILCAALGTTLSSFFEPFDQPLGLKGPRRRQPS